MADVGFDVTVYEVPPLATTVAEYVTVLPPALATLRSNRLSPVSRMVPLLEVAHSSNVKVPATLQASPMRR